MTNHPNRNWRARMRASCAQWIDLVAMRSGWLFQTTEQIRDALTQAYQAGYEAGRDSKAKRNHDAQDQKD